MGTGLCVSLEMLGERLMRFLALLSMSCRVIAYRLPGTERKYERINLVLIVTY